MRRGNGRQIRQIQLEGRLFLRCRCICLEIYNIERIESMGWNNKSKDGAEDATPWTPHDDGGRILSMRSAAFLETTIFLNLVKRSCNEYVGVIAWQKVS